MSRFRPDDAIELLTRSFEMADFRPGVYVEKIAPDLRPAILIILLLIFSAIYAVRKIRTKRLSKTNSDTHKNHKVIFSCILGWLIAWLGWLSISGNGRYAMPLLIIIGPLIGALLFNLKIRNDWRWLLFILLLAGQGILLQSSSPSKAWSMLQTNWNQPYPLPSRDNLLNDLRPDLIITPQSQTMTALLVNTSIAKNARILSLDFANSMSENSIENKTAINAITESKRPVLIDSFSIHADESSNMRNKRWGELLAKYSLGMDEGNCRQEVSPLGVMQVACALSRKDAEIFEGHTPSPAAQLSMERLTELCSNLLWPYGVRQIFPNGEIIHVFREGRYIVFFEVNGNISVRARQDLNFKLRWNGINDARPWESIRCSDIINRN